MHSVLRPVTALSSARRFRRLVKLITLVRLVIILPLTCLAVGLLLRVRPPGPTSTVVMHFIIVVGRGGPSTRLVQCGRRKGQPLCR